MIFCVMCVTAFMSMWVSNTATTMMMIPIILSVLDVQESSSPEEQGFSVSLLLAVAYGATIGGIGTLMGTPPNSLLAGFLQQRYGINLTFFDWSLVGLLFIAGLLPIAWLVLSFLVSPHVVSEDDLADRRMALKYQWSQIPGISREELLLAGLYVVTILGWVFRAQFSHALFGDDRLSDSGIALIAGILMFILPSSQKDSALLTWEEAQKLPWGVLLLFGGGLALSKMVEESGLANWLVLELGQSGVVGGFGLFASATALVLMLTELTSNIATTAAFLPVLAEFDNLGAAPLDLLVGITIAASCAFMLPVATAPNALIFATGRLKVSQMVRVGFLLNCFSWCWLLVIAKWFWPYLLPVVAKVS